MRITKRQLRRIIKEYPANPNKIRRQRRERDRQRMIDTMTFDQLKTKAFDSAQGIQGRLDTGQYEYADVWEVEIPRLADYIDAAKVKAAEEGIAYDDVPEVRHNGGLVDLSSYSMGGLPAGIAENKMRITKRQLKRLIREALSTEVPDIRPRRKSSFQVRKEKELAAKKKAMPRGGAPDMVGYLNKGRPDPLVDALIDDYEDFVEREGHATRASASVAASFFMQDPERKDDHEAHQMLADAIGLQHEDIERDMERQKREQSAMSESRRLIETQVSYDVAGDSATHRTAGGSPQVYTRDDYYDMISDFSKELTGTRGQYFRPEKLDAMDIKGVAEYYEDMIDSAEAREMNASFEAEMQKQADEEIGMERDQPALHKAPKQQGMGRRMEGTMKISRADLQRIIKEEKQRLLVEMNAMANAERMQGEYSDTAAVDAVENALSELMFGTNQDAFEDMGDEDDADEAAAAAVTLTVAQAFQSMGLLAQYEALIRTL